MKKHKSKRGRLNSQMRHAIQRAWERYGLEISDKDIFKLAEMVRESNDLIRISLTNSRTVCLFPQYKGVEDILAIYDRKTKSIATFLPQYAIEEYLSEEI